ncbi:MAG TPA: septum formation initiator family protein [Candidatus Acidoferrales bacterium]|jgi:cell division protein FtsB|nr:septum formation initiator family protein [Candidatus Acidoferrales bacterium]
MNERDQPQPFLLRNARSVLAFLAFALLVQDVFGAHGFLAMRRTQREITRLLKEIQQVNAENRDLAGQVKALKSDPRMIERIAREEMGLARPGELIFKLPAPPSAAKK